MAHTPGQVPLPPGFKIVRPTKDHFTPQPAPARLAAQRSWPNIQGSRAVLDEAIEHLEAVAARFGIRLVWQDPDERGQAGSQIIGSNSITFARELQDHPALYAWVLAHELGHAFDPRLQVMGGSEYGTKVHTDDYELVAEAVALKTLRSWGFTIDSAAYHLSAVGGKNWQRRLGKSYIRNRFVIAVDVLRKPLPPGSPEARKARQEVRKAKRAERDKYYGLDRDQKNRLRELLKP